MSKIKPHGTRTRVITEIPADTKSRVLQSEQKACDINHIVARAKQTGQLPILMGRQPIVDLPNQQTYQEMLNTVVVAQQQFARLPSSIRNQFDNKPENLLHALDAAKTNEKTADTLREMGILNAKPPEPEAKPQTKKETAKAAPTGETPDPQPSM